MTPEELLERLDVIDIKPTEFILYRFSAKKYKPEDVKTIYDLLCKNFPNNTVFVFPDDDSLEVVNKASLFMWLDNIVDGYRD